MIFFSNVVKDIFFLHSLFDIRLIFFNGVEEVVNFSDIFFFFVKMVLTLTFLRSDLSKLLQINFYVRSAKHSYNKAILINCVK